MSMLDVALANYQARVTRRVGEDGPDAHQVELDHLVWSYAHAEAARALREWAEATGHRIARALAEAAETAALAQVTAQAPEVAVASAVALAEIAGGLEPLEDLGAGDDHRVLRQTLRELAEREVKPLAGRIHRQDEDIPESIIKAVAEFGLFGLSIPAAYGGLQETEDFKAMLIATEELSRASLAAAGSLMTRPEILVRALLRGGTEEQRRTWLPAIATGEKLVAIAVTEPDFGSDVAGLTCRAKRRLDGEWEISGSKLFCTYAGRSELIMVLARTGGAGHRGLSAFVLEKPRFAGHQFEHQQPGGGRLTGRAIPTIGYRGMHTFELSFDRFRAPADALIGGEEWLDRGFYLQLEGFSMGRIQTAGRAVGLMQAAFEDASRYAQNRIVFGRPIASNQLARARLGTMLLRLEGSRRLSYRAAALLDRGEGQVEASLAKLYASRMAEWVTRDAAQIHGAMGYSEETDASRYFVDARVLPVFEGAEEVLSLRVIGRALTQPAD